MKITNKAGIPDAIFNAVANDPYNAGDADISVTSLVNAPRVVTLLRRYGHLLEDDAINRVWALWGQAVHEILMRANVDCIVEERLFAELDGWKISGQFDSLDYSKSEGVLRDWKTTSVFVARKGGKPEWPLQMGIYRWLLLENGYPDIQRMEVHAFLRDYRPGEALTIETYPKAQLACFSYPVPPIEDTLAYIRERIALHKAAREALPFCTNEDRWFREGQWALMKKGRKTAVKLYQYREMAMMAARDDAKLYVEERPGRYIRCEIYCPAASKCLKSGTYEQLNQAEMEVRDAELSFDHTHEGDKE